MHFYVLSMMEDDSGIVTSPKKNKKMAYLICMIRQQSLKKVYFCIKELKFFL